MVLKLLRKHAYQAKKDCLVLVRYVQLTIQRPHVLSLAVQSIIAPLPFETVRMAVVGNSSRISADDHISSYLTRSSEQESAGEPAYYALSES